MGTSDAKILIVEDEVMVRNILAEVLLDVSPNILQASDGKAAVEMIVQNTPDVIVMDYNMPELDGLEVLKVLQSQNNQTPVIWVTGRGTPELYRKAWSNAVFDYFEKPVDHDLLIRSVENAIDQYQRACRI